jgi:outer membrane protein assembly factor BamB
MVETERMETAARRRSLAVALLLVCALFSGVVIGAMIAAYAVGPAVPPDSPTLQSLRAMLVKEPNNEGLKDALRQEDQRVREGYFTQRRRVAAGAWLLLAGLAATVACARWYAALDKRTPRPTPPAERAGVEGYLARRRRTMLAVGGAGVALLALGATFTLIGGPPIPAPTAAPALATAAAPSAPQPAASSRYHDNWPRFRGPDGTGVVPSGEWPTDWDAATGKGIVWKTPVPAPGNSSPVLWGDRIFLTGATAERQDVMCLERRSGRLLWDTPVAAPRAGVTADDIQVQDQTGYAAPTPATDGERVYVTFASSDVAALDFGGRVLWARNLGKPESMYGRSTSLLTGGGKVFVQFDRGMDAEGGLSAMMALDAKTGATVWSTPRPVAACWATPILIQAAGRAELVASGSPWVMAYDPESGRELWRCSGMHSDVACSPTFAGGLVYVTNDQAKVLAIRPDGAGDVSESNVVWTADDGVSDASSPAADEKHFLQVTSSGRVTCYDAKAGKLLWEDLLPCALWASPTFAGGRVYLPGDDGKVYILALADKLDLLATCSLGEPLLATPAFCDGRIYLRGKDSLFCVGPPEAP